MIHFHPLQVKAVTHETADAVSIEFAVPEALRETFRFVQGQNITVRATVNGAELRRNYSMCTAPYEGVLKIGVKRVPGGRFSAWAFENLAPGDWLDVMPPVGKFYTPLHAHQKKNYLAVVAGSGITPVLSIMKQTLQTEAQSSFTLVYGNRTRGSVLFKQEIENLKDRYLSRFRVVHVLSREKTESPLNSGRIDAGKCAQLFQNGISLSHIDEVFLCGPEALIFCVKDFLVERHFPKAHIHFELFTIPGVKGSVVQTKPQVIAAGAPAATVRIKRDGVVFQFALAFNGASILDAALAQGADLPYACKGGVCCTCKARLLHGAVAMDVVWGLEKDEIENGFVLTCQSHPTTETVSLDFDVK